MSDELKRVLEEIDRGERVGLYLLWGEELLVRKAAEELVKHLIPEAAPGLSYAVLDGASPRELAHELATLPLLPGPKVVLTRDPEFLAPKKGRTDALGKSRDAWKAGRRKEAARRFLALAARAGWSHQDLDKCASPQAWEQELGISLGEADAAFLEEICAFIAAEGIEAPETDESALLSLYEKGLPEGHALVVAATDVDPKSALLRLAQKKGRVIERKVAQKLDKLDVRELVEGTLAPYRKKIAPAAVEALKDRCGGNLRLLTSELEKLAQYVDGPNITPADVELLVGRSREEEFLELSEALHKRDLKAALQYVDEALSQGAAPLAILGAVASIVRTLLVNHERLKQLAGDRLPRSYEDFQARVFPRIEAEARSAKQKVPHPYAAFMGMKAASGYAREELLGALASCAEADLALKLGGGRLVLERLLWTVCGVAAPWDSGMATVRKEWER